MTKTYKQDPKAMIFETIGNPGDFYYRERIVNHPDPEKRGWMFNSNHGFPTKTGETCLEELIWRRQGIPITKIAVVEANE